MCAVCNKFNDSFKWIMYLVVVMGAYTFLHWFLAVPLLYSHLYECCNQKFFKNWVAWFLAISFACWFGVSILIVSIWICLRLCKAGHLNGSDVRVTGKGSANPEGEKREKAKAVHYEKNADILFKSSEGVTESAKEVVGLPDFRPSDSLAVLKVTDPQADESPVSRLDFPIPVDESRHYVQSERSPTSEEDADKSPLKTPREIFFKDLIEAASRSPPYFDFDPEKIPRDFRKKYDLDKLKEDGDELSGEENNFFVGSHSSKENLTSEVLITLNEKGLMVEEPVVLGQFQILRE